MLVVDETGDLKKGTRTVAVQRLYTGRIEYAQVAVYLVYAGERGNAAVDREFQDCLHLLRAARVEADARVPGPEYRPLPGGGRELSHPVLVDSSPLSVSKSAIW